MPTLVKNSFHQADRFKTKIGLWFYVSNHFSTPPLWCPGSSVRGEGSEVRSSSSLEAAVDPGVSSR